MKTFTLLSGLCCLLLVLACRPLYSQPLELASRAADAFPLAEKGKTADILVDPADDWLVQKSALLLQQDMERLTGVRPRILEALPDTRNALIIIGTLHESSLLQSLVDRQQFDPLAINNQWEAFQLQTIAHPFRGIRQALVIAGSDKRGAAYGTLELSRQLGVSPWYWWADVPVKRHTQLYVKNGRYHYPSPSVKYRGIFINDEAPAFAGWTHEKFGGFNHLVYEKIFELLLRLKANYLWPAMWGNAFNDDDSLNPILADKWGIVMGTSHHEPMLRAQQEWKRYGSGAWDYSSNDSNLRAFWKQGIEHMGNHESIVTIGMRGDGDMPMTEGTATKLLERVVADQRNILANVTGKPAAETPQVWALYKEVQDYYDQGMRVPDDVTLLLCDDNWGNIRRLPRLSDSARKGGFGIYYHFDYVGGPRNYKWINTNNIAKVWEQMHLAYAYNAKEIWIVNVGDLKPMELPISFFMDYAWNVNAWQAGNLDSYYRQWANEQFGPSQAKEMGQLLQQYSQYSARRKPELLDAGTYSVQAYDELTRVTNEWDRLQQKAEALEQQLPSTEEDAYFQLVLHPIKAYANLQQLYAAVAWNHYYAARNNPLANTYAAAARHYYGMDSLISTAYHQLNHGKWNHMMDQKHIGYTYWQEPPQQKLPALMLVDSSAKPTATNPVSKQPEKRATATASSNGTVFIEKNGYLSIAAAHYSRKKEIPAVHWQVIPGIGRDGDGITSIPVTAADQPLSASGPHLEYDMVTYDTGQVTLQLYFTPTLNFQHETEGLQFAVSIDDGIPTILSLNKDDDNGAAWNHWVSTNCIIRSTEQRIHLSGKHVINYWAISPAVVLEKIVADFGGLHPSYLGPPETIQQQPLSKTK